MPSEEIPSPASRSYPGRFQHAHTVRAKIEAFVNKTRADGIIDLAGFTGRFIDDLYQFIVQEIDCWFV